MYRNIGAFGEGPQVEAILGGTYVFPNKTDQSVKKFLVHLQRPNSVSNKYPATLISLATYIESWKVVKENMSPQGPHIEMYKAVMQHLLLGWIFHQKSEIPYLSGYSFRRNSIITDVVLPKIVDSRDAKDLRNIC